MPEQIVTTPPGAKTMRQAIWLRPGKKAVYLVETPWGVLVPVRRLAASLAELRALEASLALARLADLEGLVYTTDYLRRRGRLIWLPSLCANCGAAWADLNGLCHQCNAQARQAAA